MVEVFSQVFKLAIPFCLGKTFATLYPPALSVYGATQ